MSVAGGLAVSRRLLIEQDIQRLTDAFEAHALGISPADPRDRSMAELLVLEKERLVEMFRAEIDVREAKLKEAVATIRKYESHVNHLMLGVLALALIAGYLIVRDLACPPTAAWRF